MSPPTHIGRYEVLALLGRGGMGEVWRARDTKLAREVAIKALPRQFANDPERRLRLEREATLLAALNHPNIAVIHGIEEHDGACFLVLELVEGRPLADRLHGNPLPVPEALDIAQQIAAGLEAAHDKGVIHRDLKPANINVTRDGRVKILDFGIAKALDSTLGGGATQAAFGTDAGMVMGTMPYMSPEQLRGEPATRQSDIWAFGVVLYEMLTGDSPFQRNTGAETIARVLEGEADYTKLPAAVPPAVRNVVRRCLEKQPRRRIRDIGDVRIQLEEALTESAEAVTRARPHRARSIAALAAAAIAGAAVGGVVWSTIGSRDAAEASLEPVRFSVQSTGARSGLSLRTEHIALTADGSKLAIAMSDRLLIRSMRDPGPIVIDVAAYNPFFSPDGRWVAFDANGIYRVPTDGGTPQLVIDTADRPLGGTWGADGMIVYATTSGLYRVAADGGDAEALARPDLTKNEQFYAWPRFLPDGRSVLFTIIPQAQSERPQIARFDLDARTTSVVLTGGTSARYLPTGHLVFASGQSLMAVAYDLASHSVRGTPIALRDVRVETVGDNGAAEVAIANNGTLAFVPPAAPRGAQLSTLAWVDRLGNEEPLGVPPGRYIYARVSPDGTRIAIDVAGQNRDIWIWDIERETLTRLTDGPTEDMTPLWSPDGRRVLFASNRRGTFDVYSQVADGSAAAVVELETPGSEVPNSIAPNGTHVVVTRNFEDIGVVDLTADELRPLLERASQDWLGEVAPDGRWIAYESDESGVQFEIYLRPFPDVAGAREKVSIDGGRYARWGPPGSNELYYVALDGAMMAAPIELAPALRIGRPAKLFDFRPPPANITGRPYDVSPRDGRFLVINAAADNVPDTFDVAIVLNWFTELREQLP